MKKKKFSVNDLIEVKVLNKWEPAYIESDMGGGWYMCRMAFKSDMFSTINIRKAKPEY